MDISKFSTLPSDVLVLIALDLDLPEILTYCRLSSRFNSSVCENRDFWINKLYHDFEIRYVKSSENPKNYYRYISKFIKSYPDVNQLLIQGVGNLDIVKYAINKNADPTYDESHALRMAVKFGHLNSAEYLLSNFEFSDDLKCRLLKIASEEGRLSIVKYLIEHGVDVRCNDNVAIKASSENGKNDVTKYLISQGANVNGDPLAFAIALGDLDAVRFLVEKGSDVNVVFPGGYTPLLIAIEVKNRDIMRYNFDIVRYLVENGANVNVMMNINGITQNVVLLLAVKTGDYDLVKYLVDRGSVKTPGVAIAAALIGNFRISWLLS